VSSVVDVDGFVAVGFEPVADEFARNFAERGELGAAFAAFRDGEPVLDLWGGVADSANGRPWDEGTMQIVFSGTKGLTATCVLLLIDRGFLDLDEPVARYWPEQLRPTRLPTQHRELMPQDDDLQLLGALRPRAKEHDLQQAAQRQVAKRPEQKTPRRSAGNGGCRPYRRRPSPSNRVNAPHRFIAL